MRGWAHAAANARDGRSITASPRRRRCRRRRRQAAATLACRPWGGRSRWQSCCNARQHCAPCTCLQAPAMWGTGALAFAVRPAATACSGRREQQAPVLAQQWHQCRPAGPPFVSCVSIVLHKRDEEREGPEPATLRAPPVTAPAAAGRCAAGARGRGSPGGSPPAPAPCHPGPAARTATAGQRRGWCRGQHVCACMDERLCSSAAARRWPAASCAGVPLQCAPAPPQACPQWRRPRRRR